MNTRSYFIVIALISCLGMSSCLNDKYGLNLSDIKGAKLVEIAPNDNPAAGAADRLYFLNFDVSNTPSPYKIAVHLNSSDGSYYNQDVTVALQRDPTAIADFNTANGTSYQFLPDSTFIESGLTVTIPAGQQFGYLTLNISTVKVDPLSQYMVAYKIVTPPAGAGISDTRKAAQFVLSVKNKYDGIYALQINTIGWAAYGISSGVSRQYPLDASGNGIGLITAGANAVTFFNYYRGDGLQPAFTAGGGPTAFGATSPKLVFDATTNALTAVVNTTPDDGRGRTFLINPAVTDSRFDAATKTVYAAYIMTQNGRPNQFIYDTLSYIRPR